MEDFKLKVSTFSLNFCIYHFDFFCFCFVCVFVCIYLLVGL